MNHEHTPVTDSLAGSRRSGRRRLILAAGLTLGLAGGAATGAGAEERFGIRAGASASPDQFYLGAHLETGPLAEQLWFRPNLEIGLGGNLVLTTVNVEFVHRIPLEQRPWTVYLGGGPAVNILNFGADHRRSGTDLEGGFNILVGAAHQEGLFFEMKVGALGSPSLKLGVGYSFP